MNFASFKTSRPAKAMFRKLGLSDFLEAAENWRSLRESIIYFNNPYKGRFVALARKCDGVASSGERVLLHAILFATDFAWLADELTEGKAWRRMDRADEQHSLAVAACIAQTEEVAAPDLLEAATRVLAGAESVVRTDAAGNRFQSVYANDLAALQAAIAKATGKQ
jgi:hypothetical protein